MPFTDEDRNVLYRIAGTVDVLPCREHTIITRSNTERIGKLESAGKVAGWALATMITLAGMAQGFYCYVK